MYFLGSILVLSCFGVIARGAPRVVGGHDAPNHKYPYQVSLRAYNGGHFCSGSILNEHWILTAAHCLDGRKPDTYSISVGTNYLNEPGDVYYPQFSYIHEDYRIFYYYDVAMIRVIGEIAFNDNVKKTRMPNVDLSDYSRPALFAGWGSTVYGGASPNNLQEIIFRLVDVEECRKRNGPVDETQICTYTKFHEGICHGDSGGPLIVDGVQVGIASWVVPCGVGHPDVYTRVYAYLNWIETTTDHFDQIFG